MSNSAGKPGISLLKWCALIGLTLLLLTLFSLFGLPAAPLLAAMLAGLLLALRDRPPAVPRGLFLLAKGVLGCIIARSFTGQMLAELGQIWPLALFSVFSAILGAAVLGWIITLRGILPGTTALWGISPGGATAMPIMAASYGGNMSLAAFMQYLRVLVVAGVASLVAGLFEVDAQRAVPGLDIFLQPVDWSVFGVSLAFAVGCALLGQLTRLPAASMLLPAILGAVLGGLDILHLDFPPWFLLFGYSLIGWSIGLGFSRELLRQAFHALPAIIFSIIALILFCGLVGTVLVVFAGVDPLTAYLATSPGGVDSVAIIAASTSADTGFVMSIQATRLLAVVLLGPQLARLASKRILKKALPKREE